MNNNCILRWASLESRIRRTSIVFSVALLSACAAFPEQDKIAAFGTAATAVSTAAANAYTVHAAIARKLSDEDAALEYISGETIDYPPPLTVKIIAPELWRARLATLDAIQSYASELAEAGKPGAADSAAASASRLASSLQALATAGNGSPIAAGAPEVASAVVRASANFLLASRMRKVIEETDPLIAQAVLLLNRDLAGLQALAVGDAATLTGAREQTLRALRRDPRRNSALLLDKFRASVDDDRTLQQTIAIYTALPAVLEKFAAAHHALVKSFDNQRALDDFLAVSGDFAAALKKMKAV